MVNLVRQPTRLCWRQGEGVSRRSRTWGSVLYCGSVVKMKVLAVLSHAQHEPHYCTVRVTVLAVLVVPEVPVTVTV